MKFISKMLLKLFGWELDVYPDLPKKCVLISYPHTSNWDFILGMLVKWASDMPLNWVAKHTMFWGPLRPFFIAIGGVPINRSKTFGFIQKNIELFQTRESFILGIMPEGTRAKTRHIKTGFYYIADGADVPIALAYIDYKHKKLGVGKMMETSGDLNRDFEVIKEFYKDMEGLNPEDQGALSIKRR